MNQHPIRHTGSVILRAQGLLLALLLAATTVLPALAASYDLSAAGSSATINGAIFLQWDPDSSAGTGNFNSFLRIQKNGTERGYNTDGTLEFDTKTGTWTHALLLSAVPTVDIGGTLYREFQLDIDQTGADPLLSLDELQLFTASSNTLTGYSAGPPPSIGGGTTLVYNLDADEVGNYVDNTVTLNYSLAGSGRADYIVLIPDSLFGSGLYVYLYAQFGVNYASNDGFEEWGASTTGAVFQPAIDIEKFTNDENADEPTGPIIAVGDPVAWTYRVENTGNVDLTNVIVVDDNGTPDTADDYPCAIGVLAAGAVDNTTCSQNGTAAAGQYANMATVTGKYHGIQISDEDPSHYFGALPQPVKPILECVADRGDGTYTAYFGYENLNDHEVTIPHGDDNKITPSTYDGGQPTVFGLPNVVPGRPGRTGFFPDGPFAFTVDFEDGEQVVWTLQYDGTGRRTATASNNPAQRCPAVEPVKPILECVAEEKDGSLTAYFGYENLNDYVVTIPHGEDNKITPSTYDGVQPTVFGLPNVVPGRPGRTGFYPDGPFAFTLNFQPDEVIVWKLGPRTSTASDNPAQRCEEPTAITLASFTAGAGVNSVILTWETATEVDNAGFNLYRATSPDGPWTQVNGALIAAQGSPASGVAYSLVDQGLAPGTYYYTLEDVDYSGATALHGPISATVAPALRRPAHRPMLPALD